MGIIITTKNHHPSPLTVTVTALIPGLRTYASFSVDRHQAVSRPCAKHLAHTLRDAFFHGEREAAL